MLHNWSLLIDANYAPTVDSISDQTMHHTDGSLDLWVEGPSGHVRDFKVDAQGRLMIFGTVQSSDGLDFMMMRYFDDGTLDLTF